MAAPTTNSMIAQRLDDLRDDMNRRFGEVQSDIAEVKIQTTETNGSVRKLQLWKAHMEGMRAANAWLLPVVSSLLSGGAVSLLVLLVTGHL